MLTCPFLYQAVCLLPFRLTAESSLSCKPPTEQGEIWALTQVGLSLRLWVFSGQAYSRQSIPLVFRKSLAQGRVWMRSAGLDVVSPWGLHGPPQQLQHILGLGMVSRVCAVTVPWLTCYHRRALGKPGSQQHKLQILLHLYLGTSALLFLGIAQDGHQLLNPLASQKLLSGFIQTL